MKKNILFGNTLQEKVTSVSFIFPSDAYVVNNAQRFYLMIFLTA